MTKNRTTKVVKKPRLQWEMPDKVEARFYQYFNEYHKNVEIQKLINYFYYRQESKNRILFDSVEDFTQEAMQLFWRLIIRSTALKYSDLLTTWKKMKNVFCKSLDRLIKWTWIKRKRIIQSSISIDDDKTVEYINYTSSNIEKSQKTIQGKTVYKSKGIEILMEAVSRAKKTMTLGGLTKRTGFSEKFIISTVIKEFDLRVEKKENGEFQVSEC